MPEREDDPQRWLAEHGDALYAYAWRRVGQRELAEDLVQDTLLAAWKHRATFRGDASRRTWLTAILRRRLVDQLRRRKKAEGLPVIQPEAEWFNRHGRWVDKPGQWGPAVGETLENQEFRAVLRSCIEGLPPDQAEAFAWRAVREKSTADCCNALGVSPSNLGVRLHRARLALRKCLEWKWFGRESAKPEARPAPPAITPGINPGISPGVVPET